MYVLYNTLLRKKRKILPLERLLKVVRGKKSLGKKGGGAQGGGGGG